MVYTTGMNTMGVNLVASILVSAAAAFAGEEEGRFPLTDFPPGVSPSFDPNARSFKVVADDLEVRVDGRNREARAIRVSAHPFNRVWPGHQRAYDQTEPATYLAFEKDGPARFDVKPSWGVTNAVVRPLSAGVMPTVRDGVVSFVTPKPGFYTVEFDGRHRAFHVFQEPVRDFAEYGAPTRLFGPGMHVVGTVDVRSGDRIYIDRNAIVFGRFRGQGVEDVKIFGAGVIDGSVCERVFDSGYVPLQNHGIGFFDSNRVTVDGPVLLNCAYWCAAFFNCEDVEVSHVKIVGQWRYNADGINACNSRRVRIRDSFVRSFDDSICVKGVVPYRMKAVEDVSVERCVLWCDWGNTCEVGIETYAPQFRNIRFADCDLIHNEAVAIDVACGGSAQVEDVAYRNIRVELQSDTEPMIHQMSDGQAYDAKGEKGRTLLIAVRNTPYGPEGGGGSAHRVKIEDVAVYSDRAALPPIVRVETQKNRRGLLARHEDVSISGVTVNGTTAVPGRDYVLEVNNPLRIDGRIVKDGLDVGTVSNGAPVTVDIGPSCEGGYAEFSVGGFARGKDGSRPVLRIAYATHPDGLLPTGDFCRETAARYLGDDVDLPILPANINRYEDYRILSNGVCRARLLQGLVRYARFSLVGGGEGASVRVDGFRLVNDKVHSQDERRGAFHSSADWLDRIWEASVRTCELAAIPSYVARHVTPPVTTLPYLSDGAKRDRLVWSGDLWFAQRNVYCGFDPREPYMRGSIEMLAANQTPEGYVQSCPWPEQPPPKEGEYGPFPSDEFAAWFVPVLWEHHLYRDERTLLERCWPTVRNLMAYLQRHVRDDGLFVQRRETSKHAAGLVFGTDSCHHRSYMNILLWKTYSDAARIADALGKMDDAARWRAAAGCVADSVRRAFWDVGRGGFVLSIEDRRLSPEADALALATAFATEDEARRILTRKVRIEHGKFQALLVRGRFAYCDPQGALDDIRAHGWCKLVDPSWPGAHLTSECAIPHAVGWGDEAHPDTAIAWILTASVLGVEPTEPGFRRFRFRPPESCAVTFASGTVPTPHGDIVASWRRDADGRLTVDLKHPDACVPVE